MLPITELLRPKNLDEFIGQKHILGKNSLLRKNIEEGNISSMIFWGPPGSGKTTLARLIQQYVNADFISYSAIGGSIKDVRGIIKIAKEKKDNFNKDTILFVDEIHRFNKSQQDAFLPFVEDGTIILIGATTENPGFEINAPLISRSRLYVFNKLLDNEIDEIVQKVLNGNKECKISNEIIKFIVQYSNGDARKAINATYAIISYSVEPTLKQAESILQKKLINYDKKGDSHFDTISAFIKSMRASDPDATLHYLARMLHSGEDPVFIARRMVIFSSEDIGNAKPNALVIATSTMQAVHMIGMPESQIILAQCATYLAICPKSIASYTGINEAMTDLDKYSIDPIPLHLRNASNKVMKVSGYGEGHIRYPWMEKDSKLLSYLPHNLKGKKYYRFNDLTEVQ